MLMKTSISLPFYGKRDAGHEGASPLFEMSKQTMHRLKLSNFRADVNFFVLVRNMYYSIKSTF